MSSNWSATQFRSRLRALLESTRHPGGGVLEFTGNLLTTAGKPEVTNLLIGGGGTALAHAHGIVGVGNGTGPALVGDTALGADNTANAFYQGFDTSNPSRSAGTITGVSTFASGVAQFTWNEFCWATSTGTYGGSETSTQLIKTSGSGLWAAATTQIMWNHAIPSPSLGTKGAVAWVLTTSATIA
jgi:hypothetical protein